MVKSPITGAACTKVMSIPVEKIVQEYKKSFDVSTERHFTGLQEVGLYLCPDTGYRFFYPFSLAGDEKLYDDLQQFPWYYLNWKWDYDAAPPYIANGSKVLEVGPGEGIFLKHIKDTKNCDCTGIELNLQAVEKGRAKGLDMRQEFVQDHAKTHPNIYDVVCFFQVLEHIADIDGFLKASVACLKPGGKLIICVPNNEPFIFRDIQFYTLNVPPHHMGWWNTQSLTSIAPHYGLTVDSVFYDHLEFKAIPAITNAVIKERSYNNDAKRNILRMLKPLFWMKYALEYKKIPGAHIMAVYTKK